MESLSLRKEVRKFLEEFFQNQVVYTDDPSKFRYLDGTDQDTPSDLDSEFDSEFKDESEEIIEKEKKPK